MWDVTIYDARDVQSPDPGSHLGSYQTVKQAAEAIAAYFHHMPQHAEHVLRVEISPSK